MTLAQALNAAIALGLDRLESQMLLLHLLGRAGGDRAWLLTHDTSLLEPDQVNAWPALLQRLAAGEPLAYLTGHQSFYGLDLLVDQRVLVPRSDTETLVNWALEVLNQTPPKTKPGTAQGNLVSVIDLGTGSGAIALALKQARPDLQVTGLDASTDALELAGLNARRLALEVHFEPGSWLTNVSGRYALIVSNPPYIAEQDPHLPALRHEPRQALTAGIDGLDDLRTIVNQAPEHLQPGGWLLLEHGFDQAGSVRDLLLRKGFQQVQSHRDLAGIERCSGGQWPEVK